MWQEKRVNKRITLSLPINYEVSDTQKKELSSTVCKDISEGGLKLMLKKFYPPKTKFLIKINLEGINRIIETMAESVWSFNMHFSNMYYNGLCFVDLSTPDRKKLKEYLVIKEITSSRY
ncbi:MAG: PilZ domain-containing protein [Candidatus Omnitrophica bacterium]|nr:PilZ domain-containing protein [Candidatus Omnitrophota bacterium]